MVLNPPSFLCKRNRNTSKEALGSETVRSTCKKTVARHCRTKCGKLAISFDDSWSEELLSLIEAEALEIVLALTLLDQNCSSKGSAKALALFFPQTRCTKLGYLHDTIHGSRHCTGHLLGY